MPYTLSDHEREVLGEFRANGSPSEARRAQIILLSETGTTGKEIAAAVDLSVRQVRYWQHQWQERGLDIFGDNLPSITETPALDFTVEDEDEESLPVEEVPPAPRPGIDEPRLPLELRETVGLLPDDAMAEAGRKVLLFHFERMLLNEPGSRLGEDIEAVHDMRVAIRRMRSALRLFRPFYDAETIRPFRRALSQITLTLGEVRDLDVFIAKAQQFTQQYPDSGLAPLFTEWQDRLADARETLIEELDGKKYRRFAKKFHAFLITPGKGALPLPESGEVIAFQVRHVAPRLIYEHYEQVRAYDTVIGGASLATLHALRIAFKRFRYTLEFFEEVLGPEVKPVIKEVKGMQDLLGDLNDTRVAGELLRDFVDQQYAEYGGRLLSVRPDITGVIEYAAAQDAEQQRLLAALPPAWTEFNRDEVRRCLALAVAAL
jgi:CHAD domain-containing protein/transposase-like protein